MNFVTGLSISDKGKSDSYNLILVIVSQLTKIIHYVPIKFIINISGLIKVIINIIICHHRILKLIVID